MCHVLLSLHRARVSLSLRSEMDVAFVARKWTSQLSYDLDVCDLLLHTAWVEMIDNVYMSGMVLILSHTLVRVLLEASHVSQNTFVLRGWRVHVLVLLR